MEIYNTWIRGKEIALAARCSANVGGKSANVRIRLLSDTERRSPVIEFACENKYGGAVRWSSVKLKTEQESENSMDWFLSAEDLKKLADIFRKESIVDIEIDDTDSGWLSLAFQGKKAGNLKRRIVDSEAYDIQISEHLDETIFAVDTNILIWQAALDNDSLTDCLKAVKGRTSEIVFRPDSSVAASSKSEGFPVEMKQVGGEEWVPVLRSGSATFGVLTQDLKDPEISLNAAALKTAIKALSAAGADVSRIQFFENSEYVKILDDNSMSEAVVISSEIRQGGS